MNVEIKNFKMLNHDNINLKSKFSFSKLPAFKLNLNRKILNFDSKPWSSKNEVAKPKDFKTWNYKYSYFKHRNYKIWYFIIWSSKPWSFQL